VSPFPLHLAPNAPWFLLALLTVLLALVSLWAYRFAVPPLPGGARRVLPLLRALALLLLLWLLAQPVFERAAAGRARIAVLVDRSRSMDLPASPGGPSRAQVAAQAVEEIRRAWRGRAAVDVIPFAGAPGTGADSTVRRGATALGDALESLARSPEGQRANGVVVVSDGAVNAGTDPVQAARALGLPVHAALVGEEGGRDRAVAGIDASATARVGQATTVRARILTTEPRGTSFGARLMDGGRELARATVTAPGGGAEATAEFRVIPAKPGLALWSAVVDSAAGEVSVVNNAREVAMDVSPGRLGVLIVSAGLNWDLAFLRRALAGDSSLHVTTWVRGRDGWGGLDSGARDAAPSAASLRGQAVVVLDALAPGEVSAGFDDAVAGFVRGGGGLLALGGPAPGLARLRAGRLGGEFGFGNDPRPATRPAMPEPAPEARDLLAWDDDAARGERAWRAAAPLTDVLPLAPGPGDRVVLKSQGGGAPLFVARRIGRGQALLVNGSAIWRWSLSSHDDLGGERGKRLWRRLARWLAEPVQGEPLRVRPERWLATADEPVRLFANLQDAQFRPLAGASVEGEARPDSGRAIPLRFEAGAAGSYVATLPAPRPGRYRVSARATRDGRELGRAGSEFAVDRWSLEEARTRPDSATLAGIAGASGGSLTRAATAGVWARALPTRSLARVRTESLRLWESPWLFAVVVGALCVEWAWRRRRGLP
jgi:hypothetical protein